MKVSSGSYVIDADYRIINYNDTAKSIYPALQVGEVCYRLLQHKDATCSVCPVLNQVHGPKIYKDPIRNMYVTIDSVEMPVEEHGLCHALVLSSAESSEESKDIAQTNENELVHMGIIQALSTDFRELYGVNIHTQEVQIYRFASKAKALKEALEAGMRYEDVVDKYIEHNVIEEDKEMLRSSLSLNNIRRELAEKEHFIVHYRVHRHGETHYYYAKCARIGDAQEMEHVVLGFANEDETEQLRQRQQTLSLGPRLRRKILIVDDDAGNLQYVAENLSDIYDVITADSGTEGLRLMRQAYRDLSLVLTDVHMPVMDGFEFVQTAHTDPLLQAVPVIMMTTGSGVEEEVKALSIGATDFIHKPLEMQVLRHRIQTIIGMRESAAALSAIEFDELTGLYTRRAFYHHVETLLQTNKNARYDMVLSDIEDFRGLNERYGERIGDAMLKNIGRHMMTLATDESISCRLSADQFVSFVRHNYEIDEENTMSIEERIRATAPVKDYVVKYAIYDDVDHNVSARALCDRLRLALATVKHQYGRNVAFFDWNMQEQIDRERRIEENMADALAGNQFVVYYQPKYETATSRIVGAEALVRWIHPEYGFMAPNEFIPVFEKNGFITKLDAYVLHRVCEDLARWRTKKLPLVPVSLNFSRRDFSRDDLKEMMLEETRSFKVPHELVHVEVTESAYVDNENSLLSKVEELKKAGFCIEMDDFGTGYSALGQLKKLPCDIIKLDASFSRNLHEQEEIVQLIIQLAHSLKLTVIAEGVETLEQVRRLQQMGCDAIQGYYFSRPLPRDGFEACLLRSEKEAARKKNM